MQPLNHLLSPVLSSVVEQMLNAGASPAEIVTGMLESCLAKCESDLFLLATEAIDKNNENNDESDRWLKESSGVLHSESTQSAGFEVHELNLEIHDQTIRNLHSEQVTIERRAVDLVEVEVQALSMLELVRTHIHGITEPTTETTDQIVDRCVAAHDPFDNAPNLTRHTHMLRHLVEIGRIGVRPKSPKHRDINQSSFTEVTPRANLIPEDFDDGIPF